MQTLFNQRSLGQATARAAALCLLALAAIHFQSPEARAQWTTPDASGNINSTNTGNVGIGTAAPSTALDVTAASGVTVRTSGASAGLSIFDRPSVPGDQIVLQGNRGNYSMLNMATKGANFGSERLSGFAMWTVDNTYTPNATQFQLQNSPAFGGVIFTQKFGSGAQGDKKVSFQTAWNQQTTPTQFVLDTNGHVGIGVSAPGSTLHVFRDFGRGSSGTVAIMGGKSWWAVNDYERTRLGFTQLDSIYDGGGWAFGLRTGDSDGSGIERLRVTSGGYVGVGTATPSAKFQVSGTGGYNTPGAAEFRLQNTAWGGSFTQHVGDTGIWQLADATTGATKLTATPGVNGAINFYSGTGGVVFNGTGRVGVGGDLNAAGNITAGGSISAKYQDLAEWVPTTQKLSAGTVVVLDTERDNHVAASVSSYDTRVAGVISAQPGIALGEAGEGKALVATTGRVKVKVDATRAPIRIGDLIVTGDQPGVAMRSEPVSVAGVSMHRPGTIIGKALEALDKGTGEILVLLSLQ